MTVPRIGVTPGDPGGIGPEVAVRTLSRVSVLPPAAYILFSPASVIEAEEIDLGVRLGACAWPPAGPARPGIYLAPVAGSFGAPVVGRAAAENGEISFRSFEAAVAEARAGRIDALVTAPISKAAWALAGHSFMGHTDYLAGFYPEMALLAPHCRFDDCLHLGEPGCAVRACARAGWVAAARYDSYRKILETLPA